MTINSKINKDSNTIIRTVTGEVRASEVKEEFDKSLSHPNFKKNMNVVWDLINADVRAASTNEILDVIAHIGSSISSRGEGYKIALAASSEMSLIMSRMFETYSMELPVSIQIFNTLEDALKWIVKEN